jgi:general secretion pathway protein F
MINAFNYIARDGSGGKLSGQIIALSVEEALGALQEAGIYVTQMEPTPAGGLLGGTDGVVLPSHERVLLLESWALLLDSGLSMDSVLFHLQNSVVRPSVRRALAEAQALLRDGMSFSDAVAASGLLPLSWAAVLEAGQERGDFIGPLRALQRRGEQIRQMGEKMVSSLLMPSVLISLVFVALWVYVTWVAPAVSECVLGLTGVSNLLLAGMQRLSAIALPAAGLFLLGACSLAWIVLRGNRADGLMGTLTAWTPVWTPLVGSLVSKAQLIVIALELQLQLEAGVPLETALHTLSRSLPTPALRRELVKACRQLRGGVPGWQALGDLSMMPPNGLALLAAGEASGKLPGMLGVVASEAGLDLETQVERLAVKLNSFAVVMTGLSVGVAVFTLMGIISTTFDSIAAAGAATNAAQTLS